MIDKNNILQGYKDSAVGVIPEEWEVKRLGEVCHDNGKYGINAPAVPYEDKLPTYLRITDIDSNGNFIKEDKMSVDNPCSSQFVLKEGDIVFARTGATVGKTYLYKTSDGELVYAGFLICFSLNENEVVPYYIKAYTETSMYNNWVRVISQRSGQPGINSFEYGSLVLPIPPLAEQKKIAEILCTCDDAIEKQSKLIEKLELRKRGLMQRLLTGKTRLPGFTEPWKKIELGEIGAFLSTNTLSRDKLNSNEGTIKNIHYGDILIKYAEIVNVSNEEIPFINKGVVVPSEYIENGDIVFADTAEDYTVGKAIEIINVNGNNIVAGLHTMLFRPRKNIFVECYLGYYINSEYYQSQLLPLTQGIKVCSITKKGISQTKVLIPEKSEQKAIASILTSADKEIQTQRKKLEALRRQKQGLMQQLLTGKIRVRI